MALPCPWPKNNPRSEGRDSCVSPAVSDTPSLYCFPEEGEGKPVRQPRMAPRSQPQVTVSEITNQHHMEDKVFSAVKIKIMVFYIVTPYNFVDWL